MRRKTTDEERALFHEAFKETRPMKPAAKKPARKAAKIEPVAPKRFTGGLDGNTADRLRKGAIEPDRRIDLHGMTEASAHRALLTFLRGSQRAGMKLALVITGKGVRSADPYAPFDMEREMRARGVLKSVVPRWFREPEFAALIADYRSAHIRHGGSGALYVYLKKKR